MVDTLMEDGDLTTWAAYGLALKPNQPRCIWRSISQMSNFDFPPPHAPYKLLNKCHSIPSKRHSFLEIWGLISFPMIALHLQSLVNKICTILAQYSTLQSRCNRAESNQSSNRANILGALASHYGYKPLALNIFVTVFAMSESISQCWNR